jgi:hypothetical protein
MVRVPHLYQLVARLADVLGVGDGALESVFYVHRPRDAPVRPDEVVRRCFDLGEGWEPLLETDQGLLAISVSWGYPNTTEPAFHSILSAIVCWSRGAWSGTYVFRRFQIIATAKIYPEVT